MTPATTQTASPILLIVPPVAKLNIPSIAVHTLQAVCRRDGVDVDTFYANIHYARHIGFKNYHTIADLEEILFLGERLFASVAHGLPPMGRNLFKLLDPLWLPDHLWHPKNKDATQKMAQTFAPIKQWVLSIDWEHLVEQTHRWVDTQAKEIADKNYAIVGCTTTLGGLNPALALLDHIKQLNPATVTLLGGALCEGPMAEGIRSLHKRIDSIFSGESDTTFPAFVHRLLKGDTPKTPIITCQEPPHLDHIPPPEYSDYFDQANLFSMESSPGDRTYLPYETSRGCRMKRCTFCGLNGQRKSYRIRHPELVLAHLEEMTARHPGVSLQMSDSVMPVEYIETLFPLLQTRLPGLDIHYEVTAHLSLNQMQVIKSAGVNRVMPGIESLSPALLKRIHKSATLAHNIAFLRHARTAGLHVSWHLLFGVPGEEEHHIRRMLELLPLLRHLQPPVRLNSIEIPRFSLYQETPETFGISNLHPAEIYEDILPHPSDKEKLAYYFTGDFQAASYEHPRLIAEFRKEFQVWVDLWYRGQTGDGQNEPPVLHIEKKEDNKYILHDSRGLPGSPEHSELSGDQARLLSKNRPAETSKEMQWAVDHKWAIISENRFIPLPTFNATLESE